MTDRRLDVIRAWSERITLPPDVASAVVGCSGGADSTALLALAAAAGVETTAVHVDHGLRAGGEIEAAAVAALARRLGAGFDAVTLDVAPGPNLEARARTARLAALEAARERIGADAVLLGHTLDDQAETVLLGVLRGSAAAGLAGMRPRRGRIVRPLLGFRRADTVEVCARLGVAPLDDPMNHDHAFRRVWLRREAIPALEAGAGRDLAEVLARQADVLGGESDFLDELADAELAAFGARPAGGVLPSDVARLPTPLARRAVRRWLAGDRLPPSWAGVERVLAVARGEARAAEVAGFGRIQRRAGVLVRTEGVQRDGAVIPVPGEGEGAGLWVEAWIERAAPVTWPDGRWVCVLDADRTGDAVTITGDGGAGVAVVSTPAGAVLWEVGYRVGAPARVTPATRRWLWLRAEPSSTAGASAR
ncbi:MAG TPA: tRNA lysidine(34) synthetase TilS [Acidimicrobiia bacterium]|nr:tRNA lysidine(34) synthetase TilS [Acidimicrobiia bacterium]